MKKQKTPARRPIGGWSKPPIAFGVPARAMIDSAREMFEWGDGSLATMRALFAVVHEEIRT
jgi:hypothetical protein